MKIKLDEIQFRKDLYPRIAFKQELVEKYSETIEWDKANEKYIVPLPPIKINQNNILIDGWHRWKAHETAGVNEIEVEIIEIETDIELKKLAYQLNSNHGLQLSIKEKKKFANEMILISAMNVKELAKLLSVSTVSIEKWTKDTAEVVEEERNNKIIELHLKAVHTRDSIAEEMEISQGTVSNVIQTFIKKQITLFFNESFKPYIYNIWNLQKADKETKHFGYFPEVFMANLLYYHTKPFDIIYDPFAGSGTTVDICKKYFRRYYCSDLKVTPGREEDIKQWKIQDGLPDDFKGVRPNLLFLDPPYWKLAKKEYSEDKMDLANMSYKDFQKTLNKFVKLLIAKKTERIAYVIRPIYGDRFSWIDPIFELHQILKDKYKIENRYVIPYSTQQYSALWVERAKKAKKCLILNRELVVWRINNG